MRKWCDVAHSTSLEGWLLVCGRGDRKEGQAILIFNQVPCQGIMSG